MYFVVLGKTIPVYGICFYFGILISLAVALLLARKVKIDKFDIACSAVFVMLGAFIGAKLLFVAVSYAEIREVILLYGLSFWQSILFVIRGGFVFYGGLIGGVLGLLLYVKCYKLSFIDFCDLFSVVLPLGHCFGRIGCHFAGCCYGIEYSGPISITYTYSSTAHTPIGVGLFPVQLFEAALLFLIFALLLTVHLKFPRKRGREISIYALCYAAIRFILEFLRGDTERGVILLSTSQWISIAIIVFVFGISIYFRQKTDRC